LFQVVWPKISFGFFGLILSWLAFKKVRLAFWTFYAEKEKHFCFHFFFNNLCNFFVTNMLDRRLHSGVGKISGWEIRNDFFA